MKKIVLALLCLVFSVAFCCVVFTQSSNKTYSTADIPSTELHNNMKSTVDNPSKMPLITQEELKQLYCDNELVFNDSLADIYNLPKGIYCLLSEKGVLKACDGEGEDVSLNNDSDYSKISVVINLLEKFAQEKLSSKWVVRIYKDGSEIRFMIRDLSNCVDFYITYDKNSSSSKTNDNWDFSIFGLV